MSDTAGFGMVPRYLRGTLTAYEIALYVALSWRADESGISWAGQPTLAQDAGMSRATVQRALKGLEAKGLVKSMPWANDKGRTSNVYALRVWADPVLSEGTVRRQGGHPMKVRTAPDQASQPSDPPSQGTSAVQIQTEVVPSQSTTTENQAGLHPTDANPRISQMQRKKNQENENQEPPTPARGALTSDLGFTELWGRYPATEWKAKTNRTALRGFWFSLTDRQRELTFQALDAYLASSLWEDPSAIPGPKLWLENEPWTEVEYGNLPEPRPRIQWTDLSTIRLED